MLSDGWGSARGEGRVRSGWRRRDFVAFGVAAKPFNSSALRMMILDSESWRGVNRVGASAAFAVGLANGFGARVFLRAVQGSAAEARRRGGRREPRRVDLRFA